MSSPVMCALWLRSTPGQVLARVLGRSLFSERGWARYCGGAMATGHVNKAVGDFTARRRSAKTRLAKTSAAKRHAFTTRRRTHMSGGGATWDVAVSKQVRPHTRPVVSSARVGGIGYRILFYCWLSMIFAFHCFVEWFFGVVPLFSKQI